MKAPILTLLGRLELRNADIDKLSREAGKAVSGWSLRVLHQLKTISSPKLRMLNISRSDPVKQHEAVENFRPQCALQVKHTAPYFNLYRNGLACFQGGPFHM